MDSPSARAALARDLLDVLPDDQIVYVDRLGPRILSVPLDPAVRLGRQTLRDLDKGNLAGSLGRGARFLSRRMLQCPEIIVSANGHYTVEKKQKDHNAPNPRSYTVKTLDIWTGKLGVLHEDRNLDDLVFYSVAADELPAYHSWTTDKLERRESSVELERQEELALAELEYAESPKPLADMIDEYKEKLQDMMDESASNDAENMLRFRPDIGPSDPAWEGLEEYFKWILEFERQELPDAPQVYRVLQDELLESQRLLAIPAINRGYRAKIQDEHAKIYHEALATTFDGKPDNLATKLTMLCFGLPIEPLTAVNVKFAGGSEDVPAHDTENQGHGRIMERILWSENPLEFLDRYNERSYGYPMIRTQKRKHEELDSDTMESMLTQAQERSKHPRLLWDDCGFSQIENLEQGLHLRGGAGAPAEIPGKPQKRTYFLYTDLGRFIMNADNSFGGFCHLIRRLFRLESLREWNCQIDLIPILLTESGAVLDTTKRVHRRTWSKSKGITTYVNSYETLVINIMNKPFTRRLRVRNNPVYPSHLTPTDLWEPTDDPSLVNLEVRDVGIAYWYIPSSPVAVNIRQETFRNAVECLIPHHRDYLVRWSIKSTAGTPDQNGQLFLMTEAPSMALWNATKEASGFEKRVTITLEVIDEQRGGREVKILMPGLNQKGHYDRNHDEDFGLQNTEIFPAIRTFAPIMTGSDKFPLRIWSGVQNYQDFGNVVNKTKDSVSMILPATPNLEAETNIWMSEGLAYTWDTVVVKPEFERFMIHCLTGTTKEDHASGDYPREEYSVRGGLFTLALFRRIVSRMSNGFDEERHYVSIKLAPNDKILWVGPGMTQHQWHFQVFSWFDRPDLYYQVHQDWSVRYIKDVIEGPLGPTYNRPADSLPPPVPPERVRRNTPPLLDDPPSVTKRPETGGQTQTDKGTKPRSPQSNPLAAKPSTELPAPSLVVTSTQQLLNPSLWSTTKPSSEPLAKVGTEIGTLLAAAIPTGKPAIPPTGKPAVGPTIGPAVGLAVGPAIGPAVEPAVGSAVGSLIDSPPELLVQPPLGGQTTGPRIKPVRKDPFQGRSSSQAAIDAYRKFQKKEAEQEQKRVEAYSHDESLYQHGKGLEIPRFGPAIEGNIPAVARNFPTIFTAMSTPTENADRDRELESLKKIALERLDYCGVCQLALPAGAHNSAVRELHFQNHRDLQDGHLHNLIGKLNQAVGFNVQDVYYCEYCGKTPAEFKKDNKGLEHGPSCALRTAFHNVPQYCEYCRRNFWDNNMTKESVLRHLQNCANIRRVSTQGQIALYQTLLSRAVGNEQPTGASTCHFEGCQQIFKSTTTNIDRANHFLQHLDRNDKARRCSDEENTMNAQGSNVERNLGSKSCPFQGCSKDFTGIAGDQMIAHLQEHIGWGDDDSCPIPHCGMELKRLNVDQVLFHLLEHMNDETEKNLKCPFDGCNEIFRNKKWEEIITHLNSHLSTKRRLCPVKTCGKELLKLDIQQVRKHFEWHFGMGRHLCPFLGCGEDIRGYTEAAFKTHFDTHCGGPDRVCLFPGCGVDLANYSSETNEAHIRKHVYVHRCPFQHCKMDLGEYNEVRRKAHLNDHLGQRRDLKDHRCPVEGCDTLMRAWTEKRRFEHFMTHSIASGNRPLWPGSNCPFENCSHSFTGLSQADITLHLRTHSTGPQSAKDIQRTGCQLCVFPWNGADVEMLRTHFHFTHYPENPTDFVCPLCQIRVTNNAGTVMTHYRNHVNDSFCTWEGCHYQHPITATSDDRRRHLLTHVGQVCQWPDCTYIAPQLSTTAASAEERRQHLLQHVGRFCPWEKCKTTFPEDVTPRDIEQHILQTHISGCQWPKCYHRFQEGGLRLDGDTKNHYRDHVRHSPGKNQPVGKAMKDPECQWPGCSHDFDEKTELTDIENHYRTHLPNQCPVPRCQMVFPPDMPDNVRSRHVRTHMSRRCPIPGCDFRFRELAEEDEKRNHVASHMTIKCPVPACPYVFRDAATDEEKIQHIRDHISMGGTWASPSKEHQCHWPGCGFVFDANIGTSGIEQHFRSHVEQDDTRSQPVTGQPVTGMLAVTGPQPATGTQPVTGTEITSITPPVRIQRCFWPNCAVEFEESSTAAERIEHFRTHLRQQCPFAGCGQVFEAGVPALEIRRHFHTHLPPQCSYPDCSFVFSDTMTNEQKIAHMHTHCNQKCQWPDCAHVYLEEPTDEDIIAHYIAHARTHGVQPAARVSGVAQTPDPQTPTPQTSIPQSPDPQSARPQEQQLQVVGPQVPGPSGGEPVGEDQDNIPQRLRDAHQGLDFYCPHCLYKVSGGNSSACRRHRKPPCNTVGHNNWHIGTADDRKQWQVEKKSGTVLAPNNPAPRTTAGNNRGDPTYRPPATGDEETEDDQPAVPPDPRVSGRGTGRKRKRGGNDGGDTVGSMNKRQKK